MLQSIEQYINELDLKLKGLPKDEREHHLAEIRDHLLERMEEGDPEARVVQSFMAPDKMSEEILQEYRQRNAQTFEHPNYWFVLAAISVIAPFGALALPIIQENYYAGPQFAVLLQLLIGSVALFGYFRKKLNEERVAILKKMGRLMIPILALPFGFFSFSIIRTEEWSSFNFIYLLLYLLVWLIYYISLRKVYQSSIA
ncbi:hypothetical protein EQV77_15760 [Halobacillus fulvus]|nr:hypothetical protein EQV77_15760 [Halobacillus fulvus]